MTAKRKPKSLGQVAYEYYSTQAYWHPTAWNDLFYSEQDLWALVVAKIKRAVLRDLKPQLDAAKHDASMVKLYRETLETIADDKTRSGKLARAALGFADQLEREEQQK